MSEALWNGTRAQHRGRRRASSRCRRSLSCPLLPLLALQVGELMLAAAARQGADFQPAQIKRIQVRPTVLPGLIQPALRMLCSRRLPVTLPLSPWLAAQCMGTGRYRGWAGR